MSLDKSIEHGKEHRKKYYGAKAVDRSCRNHGDCDWCRENRSYRVRKQLLDSEDQMDDRPWKKRNRNKDIE